MILFGSSPDALARQQAAYDQLYSSANQANADNLTRASLTQAQLDQAQQQEQQRQQDMLQGQQFQAGQNALDRQSRLQDVTAQYALDAKLRNNQQVEQDFNNAVKDAMNGALPADTGKLKKLYPHFNDNQIGQLYQMAGSASVARVQQSAALADKNGIPPDPNLLAAAGVPSGSDFEKQAQTVVQTLRQPYEQQYKKSSELADTGTRLQRIAQDQATPPLPEGSASWWNVPGKIAGWITPPWVPQSAQIQPGGRALTAADVQARMAAFQQAVKSQQAMVAPNPNAAGYVSNVPANWAPAFSTTSTAPAMPTAVPPPGEQPAANPAPKVITDRQGRQWIYKGSLPDPTQDRNPANWQPA